jgi:hypothetical protein
MRPVLVAIFLGLHGVGPGNGAGVAHQQEGDRPFLVGPEEDLHLGLAATIGRLDGQRHVLDLHVHGLWGS